MARVYPSSRAHPGFSPPACLLLVIEPFGFIFNSDHRTITSPLILFLEFLRPEQPVCFRVSHFLFLPRLHKRTTPESAKEGPTTGKIRTEKRTEKLDQTNRKKAEKDQNSECVVREVCKLSREDDDDEAKSARSGAV